MSNPNKFRNTLIQECGDCPDILDGARAVLDFLSKVEFDGHTSLRDESAKYWINRMAIDALEYVSVTTAEVKKVNRTVGEIDKSKIKPFDEVDWDLTKEVLKCMNKARNKELSRKSS